MIFIKLIQTVRFDKLQDRDDNLGWGKLSPRFSPVSFAILRFVRMEWGAGLFRFFSECRFYSRVSSSRVR